MEGFNKNTVKKSIGTFRDGTGKKIYMLQISDYNAVNSFVKNRFITHYLKTDPNSIKLVSKEIETVLKELPQSAKDKFNSVIENMDSEADRVSEFVDLMFFDSEFNHAIRKIVPSFLRLDTIFKNVVRNNHFDVINVKDGREAIKGLFRFKDGNYIKFEKKSDIIESLIKMDSKISDFDLHTKEGTLELIKYVNESDFEINGSKVYLEPLNYTDKYFMAKVTPTEVDLSETAVNGSVIPLKLDPIEVFRGRQIYYYKNKYYESPHIVNDFNTLLTGKIFNDLDHVKNYIKGIVNKQISRSYRSVNQLIRTEIARDSYTESDNIVVYNSVPISVGDIIPIVDVKAHKAYRNKKVFNDFSNATPTKLDSFIREHSYYKYAESTDANFPTKVSKIDVLIPKIKSMDRFEAFDIRMDYNFREAVDKYMKESGNNNPDINQINEVIKNNYIDVIAKSLEEAANAPLINFEVTQVSETKYFKPDKANLITAGDAQYDATLSMDNPTTVSKGNILLTRIENIHDIKSNETNLYYKRDKSLTSEAVQIAEMLKSEYGLPIEYVTPQEVKTLRDISTKGFGRNTYLANGKIYMDIKEARTIDLVSDYTALVTSLIRNVNRPVYDAIVQVLSEAYPSDFGRILKNKVESVKEEKLLEAVTNKLKPALQEGIISQYNNAEVANELGKQISNVFRLSDSLQEVNINDIMGMEVSDLLASFGTTFKSPDAIIRMSTQQYKLADPSTSSIVSELINNGTLQQGIECK